MNEQTEQPIARWGLANGLRDAGFTVRANLLTESTTAVGL